MIRQELSDLIDLAVSGIERIPEERLIILDQFVQYLNDYKSEDQLNLIFICIHNSRRSHLAQIWSQVAAHYYGLTNIRCYSGGTEATAVYPAIIETIRNNGLNVQQLSSGNNPVYAFKYDENAPAVIGFSKKYDHPFNPQTGYAAIMVCSEAGEQCPFIPEASKRLVLAYNDPKEFDGTPFQYEKYQERSLQIATEMFYVFSKIK